MPPSGILRSPDSPKGLKKDGVSHRCIGMGKGMRAELVLFYMTAGGLSRPVSKKCLMQAVVLLHFFY